MFSYSSILGLSGSNGGRYIEILEHKFLELIFAFLKHVRVDETWYCEMYKDVDDAIKTGKITSARQHYMEAGYFEDRLPHWIVVDVSWYLKQNPDVVDAIKRGDVASAEDHFFLYGFKEGRAPFPGWSLLERQP